MNFGLKSSQVRTLASAELFADIRTRLSAGERIISYFASPSPDAMKVHLNAALLTQKGTLDFVRASHPKTEALPALTLEFPLFHCFEREMAEEWGLKFAHHPWLKPIRFSGEHQRQMSSYPFFEIEGKEVHEVAVGPVHAGVIEPGAFRFMCYGEKVHHLEIHLGYQHRGIHKLLLDRPAGSLAPLVESIAGDTAAAHAWAYAAAFESLCGVGVPEEFNLVRGIALELERIAMHLTGLAGIATDVAFLPGGSTYGRLRTGIINTSMRFCASRFGRGWIRPGEMRFRGDAKVCNDAIATLKAAQRDIALINRLFQDSVTVRHRLKGVGQLSNELTRDMGFVGMSARSAGVRQDLRVDLASSPFDKLPIAIETVPSGDCWARGVLRIQEIERSFEWLFGAIKMLSQLEVSKWKVELPPPAPNTLAFAAVEGWRGEVFHCLETDSSGRLLDYRTQDPSLRNWFALALSVRENAISDFPICNKSFDLSYCGNDL